MVTSLAHPAPLFPVYEHVESEAGEDGVLELGVLVHDDGDDAHVRQEAPRPAHHVLAAQPVLQRDRAISGM